MNRTAQKRFWVRWWWGIGALLVAGCCTTYPGESYIAADEGTYIYAQPKLEEWARQKETEGDPEWVGIVKHKGISWKARIDRGKTQGEENSSE